MNDHRRHRLSVAPPPPSSFSRLLPLTPSSASTPSKLRRPSSSSSTTTTTTTTSLVLLLFSLHSLYSLLPFLRSSPSSSFPLLPFSFLVSLLSSLLSLALLPRPLPALHFSLPLLAKSLLLSISLLLRLQSLRYLSAAATILADLSGSLLAHSLSLPLRSPRRLLALTLLLTALSLLSLSWDRTGCSPLSPSSPPPPDGCSRFLPMLLPFLSGFLAFHERASSNWHSLRPLGRRPIQLLSLSLTTAILFVPASISFFTSNTTTIPISDLGWPLINTVIFGVILSSGRDKATAKDFHREFLVTFFCTLLLELIYFPKLSLPGFLFCGLLLWIAVHELGSSPYLEIGSLESPSESLYSMAMNLIKHILSERKSRKIAVFLLINTAYMVVEFVVGFMSNSLGLISDACHMLFDCAALAIGLYASYISRMPANNQFNYGRGRFEVVSGYVNAVLLVLVGALIVLESFERILDPQEISTNSLLAVSIGGLVVNMVGLVFFHEEHHLAHGGGSACSHSHSQHSHHDHQNEHKIPHIDEHRAHCSNSVPHSHGSFEEHSHGGHNHHICNHDHDHHHDHKDASRIDANTHCHDHQPEHKCHDHQHDHQDHQHHDSSMDNHEHQGHVGHDSKGHIHNDCNHDKESHIYQESQPESHMLNHTHSHSLLSKEPHLTEDLRRKPKHHHVDHNMEGIFLHVLADTMGSVGVVISTLLIKYKGWMVSDPACSIFISVMIISSVIPLLRNSAEILLQRVPRHHEQDFKVALNDLMRVEGVSSIRNVHIWNLTNTDIVGTLHLHVSAESDKTYLKKRASDLLVDAGMKDVTIQVESVIQ